MTHTIRVQSSDAQHIRFAAFTDTDRYMSGGTLLFRTLHFAGKPIPCGAVGGVGTEPEYRRGGLVRELFTEMAAECDRRALPLTVLHPFSFAYYRAFGFERVADHRVLEFPIKALDFVPRYPHLIPCEESHRAELAEVYHAYARMGRHLLFTRAPEQFPVGGQGKVTYLSRDGAGRADGYLVLEVENYFSVNRMVSVNLHVHELIALTEEALCKLFGFLRMYEGEMETVKLENIAASPEVELRLRHYMHTSIRILPDIMARINDVKLFFESVPFPAEGGCFTVRTAEPPRSPWSGEKTAGTWRVTYREGEATVERLPDGSDYDFAADIPALTQLVFGYDSYGYDTARLTEGTVWNNPAPDFFRAFPRRPAGIFEHF